MGNSSLPFQLSYSCNDDNISRNSVTPEYWSSHTINFEYTSGSVTTAVFMLLFMLIGLPGNALIIVSIIQQRLYKEVTHILLLNLAISDFLVCLLIMPFTVVAGFTGDYVFGGSDYTRCQVCQTGVMLTSLAILSVNILALISLDRFIFIKFPLRYENWITVPRVIVAIVLAWIVSILEGIVPLFGLGEIQYAFSFATCVINLNKQTSLYYGVLLVLLALVPIIVTIVTNVWTACIVRNQIMKVYRTRRSFGNKEELRQYNQGLRKEIHKKRNRKQLVLRRAFGAILISNIVVWIPCVIHVIVLTIIDTNLVPVAIYCLVFICFLSHTVIHPFVEGCFIPEIKLTIKKFLGITVCTKKIKKRKESSAIAIVSLEFESGDATGDNAGRQGWLLTCRKCCDACSIALLPNTEEEEDTQ